MKSSITGEEMRLIRDDCKMVFRKDEFVYVHLAFQDKQSEELFTTAHLNELIFLQIYNQYREK